VGGAGTVDGDGTENGGSSSPHGEAKLKNEGWSRGLINLVSLDMVEVSDDSINQAHGTGARVLKVACNGSAITFEFVTVPNSECNTTRLQRSRPAV
jgi:hypothetical protein